MGIEPNISERDQGLLVQVMEVWEELDSVETLQEFEKLQEKIQNSIKETVQGISRNFKIKNYQKVQKLTIELKYWYSIRDQVLNMELEKSQKSSN